MRVQRRSRSVDRNASAVLRSTRDHQIIILSSFHERCAASNVAAVQAIHRRFHGALAMQLKHHKELLPVSSAHARLFKPLGRARRAGSLGAMQYPSVAQA